MHGSQGDLHFYFMLWGTPEHPSVLVKVIFAAVGLVYQAGWAEVTQAPPPVDYAGLGGVVEAWPGGRMTRLVGAKGASSHGHHYFPLSQKHDQPPPIDRLEIA